MAEIAVDIDDVWKEYIRGSGSYLRLSELLTELPSRLFGRRPGPDHEHTAQEIRFWAIRAVTTQIHVGEVLGLIGPNGAGKSTLLKILSRITTATRGRVAVRGRVGSLLEVGTGFHPELTGVENIFLNGALLGMKRVEIRRRLDEIVAFAELEKSIHTPVKHYSSGMYVRLAFSVAAHLQTDVLLVDEVLAVGDAKFQRQCLGKLKEISEGGRTIIFVSHNMAAVSGLCSRAIYLNDGQIRADGVPATVIGEYLSQTAGERLGASFDKQNQAGSEKLELHSVQIAVEDDVQSVVTVRTPFRIEVTFSKLSAEGRPNVSLYLYNMQGVCLFNTVSPLYDLDPGRYQATVRVPGNLLNNGLHRLRVMLASDLVPAVDVDSALSFTVQDTERSIPVFGEWTGAVRPDLSWSLSERILS